MVELAPTRKKSLTDNAEPSEDSERADKEPPRDALLNTDSPLPRLATDREDKALPVEIEPVTLREEPSLANEAAESELKILSSWRTLAAPFTVANEPIDIVAETTTEFATDIADPKRVLSNTLKHEPSLAKDKIDKELPSSVSFVICKVPEISASFAALKVL